MKTLATVSVLSVLAASTAWGADALPPTYIVHKLTTDGVQLRSLEAENGIYEAKVEATDGTIIKVGVDPQTADLTDAFTHTKARPARDAAPKVSAAEAVQVAAMTGYWDVGDVEYKQGVWNIDARDDQGRSRQILVDGVTAQVK